MLEFLSTKIFFAKGYAPNWLEEVFVINKIKNTFPWTYVINDLNGEKIIGSFYEKLRDKLYVKWKGYDNSFNS